MFFQNIIESLLLENIGLNKLQDSSLILCPIGLKSYGDQVLGGKNECLLPF